MLRIGLLALAVLAGVAPAWAAEPQRTFPGDEMNKDPQKRGAWRPRSERPHTLSCWEGGIRVFQEKNVTIRHYTGVGRGGMLLSVIRKDGREIVVYPDGGLCFLEEQ